MTKKDSDAIKWAIKKYWRERTDAEIAFGLKADEEVVRDMRLEMDLKGNESLKDFARRYLLEMTDADKRVFMDKLPADLVWKMAEGSPSTSGTLDVSTEPIIIDITHQLLKVYGPADTGSTYKVLEHSESGRLPERAG